ncbi:hypothetical protein BHM03_00024838 [Ensete ventricosum]|nr:hypothetical protein B296_00013461 [Ensete ventricosum]RZR95926.1 hypothetical protein BHM03_00024838 [Ensete ventricosum]
MSFSSDFNMQPPPARTPGPPPDPDFEFSVGSHPMMAADQLFFKGRLLPLKDNHQRGGHRITTLRDELRANGSGERLPKGPVKWRGLLGLRKTAAKKGDKKEDELLGKSSQVGISGIHVQHLFLSACVIGAFNFLASSILFPHTHTFFLVLTGSMNPIAMEPNLRSGRRRCAVNRMLHHQLTLMLLSFAWAKRLWELGSERELLRLFFPS